MLRRVDEERKPDGLPEPPRLPERAAIYIAPDGNVHFGALFEGLLPVADALRGAAPSADLETERRPPRPATGAPSGSELDSEECG
jgi:hypothetical protein